MIFLTMFIQSFAQTTWTFAAASFFQGFSAIVNYLVGFVLGECTENYVSLLVWKYRTKKSSRLKSISLNTLQLTELIWMHK